MSLIDETVLPSLSLLHCNCSLAEEVWAVLRILPYDVRWVGVAWLEVGVGVGWGERG